MKPNIVFRIRGKEGQVLSYNPKQDITTHELALLLPLMGLSNPSMKTPYESTVKYLTDTGVIRHFETGVWM